METVTLGVASREAVNNRFLDAFEGMEQGPQITFESAELLFRILTQPRRNIISSITGTGPVSIPEIARCVRCDIQAVDRMCVRCSTPASWSQLTTLSIVFRYAAVRVDFMLTAPHN
jgi:predicted transcriptional regulator